MGRKKDLKGQRFGKLVVLGDSGKRNHKGHIFWNCICDCGNHHKVIGWSLTSGHTNSCGCYQKELNAKHPRHLTHGTSNEKVYGVWKSMLYRCYNPKAKHYKDYGARGITVCDEWRNDVRVFREWALANGYKEGLSIERIDVNKNYCPENCTWIPINMQGNNTRRTVRYKGKSISMWAKELGISRTTVYSRFFGLNWPIEEALGLVPHVFSEERYKASWGYKYYQKQRENHIVARGDWKMQEGDQGDPV